MKWFLAGLALVFASLAGGIAAIIFGYRQVINRYMGEVSRERRADSPETDTAQTKR